MILRCTLYTVLKTRFTKCLRHAQVDFFYVDHDKFMHHALHVLDSSVYGSLISTQRISNLTIPSYFPFMRSKVVRRSVPSSIFINLVHGLKLFSDRLLRFPSHWHEISFVA